MGSTWKKFDLEHFFYQDTSFDILMSNRIQHVLLICSTYDAFILEEDGRINEQIFQEYVSHNLRYPPIFFQVHSAEEAFETLSHRPIDLIISMLSISDKDPFTLSREIKERYPKKPIVVLTPFSREVRQRLAHEDLSAIDYVFSWLGNTSIMLAIIKLIEDRMNAQHDIRRVGVQVVLLVEDSIRYYSSYLPNMYRILFNQSKEFMNEALNEHQMMLRLRGRPKILLATNFEDAISLYEKYKTHVLGIISDVSFNRGGVKDPYAGVKLCQIVKTNDPYLPFLLQSSDYQNERFAKELKVKFLHKYSKTLLQELKGFIVEYMAFGDFVFIDPSNQNEIARATDLQSLQKILIDIPVKSLKYHIERNHFSKWLRARALFTLARLFRQADSRDFDTIEDVRVFLLDAIDKYRAIRSRGIISKFDREKFNEYLIFSRIGEGSLGGKARGLAFIDSLVKRNNLFDKYENVQISIPRTVVVTTEFFDEFMEANDLYPTAMSDVTDEEILNQFLHAALPERLIDDIREYIKVVANPVAVRSSSLLEDSHYQPFAGIYSTYMLPRIADDEAFVQNIAKAIKGVYASVFYRNSKSYMAATANVIDQEKMAVVLQEVCGAAHDNKFYPTISGVARSINFYPIAPEKSEEGIVNLAFGLGKYIVDGGVSLRFSPAHPTKIIQLSSPEFILRDTQKHFYALNMEDDTFEPFTDDGANLIHLRLSEAKTDPAFKFAASVYDLNENRIVEGTDHEGMRVATFSRVLIYKAFPLPEILQDVMQIGSLEMGNPVEIEFAVNMNVPKGKPIIFSLLQIRPIVDNKENITINKSKVNTSDCIICSNQALGNGLIDDVRDFLYVKPDVFDASATPEIASMIENYNAYFVNRKKPYVLVGPGRWGSSDPWLGIPVKWSQISAARLIVEASLDKFHVDPSQGTHFFQNLTSFRVGYFTINPHINEGIYDLEYLSSIDCVSENKYLRHVRFPSPITILLDGKNNTGIILKPGVNHHEIIE